MKKVGLDRGRKYRIKIEANEILLLSQTFSKPLSEVG